MSKKREDPKLKRFGGFNYHEYAVPVIIMTVVTLFFCAYLFTFGRPMWIVTCFVLVASVSYIASLEGTPENRQVQDYDNYLDSHSFKTLHKALKSAELDSVTKSILIAHLNEKYPDWDDKREKQKIKITKKANPPSRIEHALGYSVKTKPDLSRKTPARRSTKQKIAA